MTNHWVTRRTKELYANRENELAAGKIGAKDLWFECWMQACDEAHDLDPGPEDRD